jgi:hypothetical protein
MCVCTVNVYCVQCTLSPQRLKLVNDWPAISVSTWHLYGANGMVWLNVWYFTASGG